WRASRGSTQHARRGRSGRSSPPRRSGGGRRSSTTWSTRGGPRSSGAHGRCGAGSTRRGCSTRRWSRSSTGGWPATTGACS
ncbi:MAG: hypothetical protein AVDCRST_MAG49-1559, partial [uncultured Thermomicrobiales bacterium]